MKDRTGKSFEIEFADWMEEELGYQETKTRVRVKGKVSDRGYEPDIHGIYFDRKWDVIRKLGIGLMVLALLTIFLPREFKWFKDISTQIVGSVTPDLVGYALLIVGALGFILAYKARDRTTTHAWVECKDRKTSVKRLDIVKLASDVEDVRKLKEAKWHPDDVIMVSSSGFDHDALEFAEEKDIICYEKTEDGFEEV